jgi:hypothetical protein
MRAARENNSERCERPKDLVEARGIARVSSVDKELDIDPLVDGAGHIARLLGDLGCIGIDACDGN